jgi:hypothetical protein
MPVRCCYILWIRTFCICISGTAVATADWTHIADIRRSEIAYLDNEYLNIYARYQKSFFVLELFIRQCHGCLLSSEFVGMWFAWNPPTNYLFTE